MQKLFLLFLLLLLQLLISISLAGIIGLLVVFFRDVSHIYGVVLQLWFWLTPIIYPISILPNWGQEIVRYNPMTPLVMAYQEIILKGEFPSGLVVYWTVNNILTIAQQWVIMKKTKLKTN